MCQVPNIACLDTDDTDGINEWSHDWMDAFLKGFTRTTQNGAFVDSCLHHTGPFSNIGV